MTEFHLLQEEEMFSTGPVVLFKWRNEAGWPIEDVSSNIQQVLGYTPQECINAPYADWVFPEDQNFLIEKFQNSTPLARFGSYPYRLKGPKDKIIWILHYIAPFKSAPSQLPFFTGYIVNITDRIKAEKALKASETRYRQMFETNLAIKLIIDPKTGNIVEANDAALQFYGYDYQTLTKMNITEINTLSVKEVKMEMERARKEARLFFKFRHKLASGKIRDVEVYSGPILTEKGELLYSIIHDVTTRRRAEEALLSSHQSLAETLQQLRKTQDSMVQRERLAAIGQLTAGIAHDFNNILTSILGFTELLQLSPETPESIQEDLQHITNSGQRAAQLIRRLLDFTRKSIRHTCAVDLAHFLQELTDFLKRTIPANIQLSLKVEPGTYLIEADLTQLQQLFTNLIVNAKDALKQGGSLEISLSSPFFSEETEPCILSGKTVKGNWIQVQLKDNGCGISKEALPHIFEPFFTTKKVGEGSGLGLAQVAGITGQHGARLLLESEEGEGSTFSLYFPPIKETENLDNPQENTQKIQGHHEMILLVEDDATVRKVSQAMLESLNYKVISAPDGKEALKFYGEYQEQIVLVLSDMIMPDMDGQVLYEALKNYNPDIKMIIMSGYPQYEDKESLPESSFVSWVQKPMSVSQLSQVLNKVLHETQG